MVMHHCTCGGWCHITNQSDVKMLKFDDGSGYSDSSQDQM